jgi:outer membrane protein TolC
VTEARNDTLNTLNSSSLIRSAGVQFSLPIFAGGGTVAATEQAVKLRDKAVAELNAAIRTALERVRSRFLSVQSAAAKLLVYEGAVAASRTALEGIELGFSAGIRTNIDVLDAQRQLQAAQRELAQVRYLHLLGILQLKAAAGTLTDEALTELDRYLVEAAEP